MSNKNIKYMQAMRLTYPAKRTERVFYLVRKIVKNALLLRFHFCEM